jgi:hypothetical protein
MLINLLVGLPTMVFCLLLQSLLVMVVVRYYGRHLHQVENPSFVSSLIVINMVMLLLVVGNLMQVAIWALLFLVLEEFQTFGEAFYHSAVNFATLGYGDFVMSAQHKLLGPLQAINGVLMIGVSSAALMSAFQDTLKKTIKARRDVNRGPH